jgi:hypothetical protein
MATAATTELSRVLSPMQVQTPAMSRTTQAAIGAPCQSVQRSGFQ